MRRGRLKGWRGIGPNTGEYVAVEDGFGYACQQAGIESFDETAPDAEEFKELLIEWFFSGNWLEVYEDG